MPGAKTVLLTGAGGFVGRNFLEIWGNRYRVIAPLHSELDLLDSKQTEAFFQGQHFDVVVHAAGQGVSRSQAGQPRIYENNLAMFLNLAHQRNSFSRLINLGSGAEYGKQQPVVKAKESDFGRLRPQDDYGRAKYEISEYIAAHDHMISLRCFGIFGKYEDYTTRFISNTICQSLAGQPIRMKQNTIFDYTYINDLAQIVRHFIDHEPQEKFYNVGSGQGIELLALAQLVKQATKNPREIEIEQPGLGKEYTCDNSLLLQELGSFTFTPFVQAIEEMTEWYKSNWPTIRQDQLNIQR